MMQTMKDWDRRERVLLEDLITRFDEGAMVVTPEELTESTGLSELDVRAGLKALHDGHLIGTGRAMPGDWIIYVEAVSGDARRAVGAWPPLDQAGAFLIVIERAIARTDDPERKTKLIRLRDAGVDLGAKVLGEVLAKLATGAMG